MLFRQLDVTVCLFELLQMLVRQRHQQLRPRSGLDPFRSPQHIEGSVEIPGSHEQFSEQHRIVNSLWIGRDHLVEQMFGFLGPAHVAVGLGESGDPIQRGWIQLKASIIGIDSQLKLSVEPSRIAQEKP